MTLSRKRDRFRATARHLCAGLVGALLFGSLTSYAQTETPPADLLDVEDLSCTALEWRRGRPFDFYSSESRRDTGGRSNTNLLYFVESFHFNNDVRMLRKGQSTALPGDLIFVLTSIPNHPAGLDAYSRFVQRWNESETFRASSQTRRPTYSPDCFFYRAASLYPQHGETWLVWGIHTHRMGKPKKALEYYEVAGSRGLDSAEFHYHRGLSLVAIGDKAGATEAARIAEEKGYPLQGLRKLLRGS